MIKSKITNLLIPPPPTTARILTNKQKAFTLAETLIALTIIGIIAAMILPNLIHKQQEHAMRVKFLKYINVVSQAHKLCWREEGEDLTPILDWRANNGAIKNQNATKLKTYYKIAKGPWTSYWGGAYDCLYINSSRCQGLYKNAPKWKYLNGEIHQFTNSTTTYFQLQDGAVIAYTWPGIYVDVNGPKGPNTIAKDIFILSIKTATDGSPQIIPFGAEEQKDGWWRNQSYFYCYTNSGGWSCSWEIFKNINYKIPVK